MPLLHPTDDRLAEFALGTTPPEDTLEIGTHLAECPHCLSRLESNPVEDPFVARVREAAATRGPEDTQSFGSAAEGSATVADRPATLAGYRIERELGRGGMGSVYLAHDDQLHRDVALKTMRPAIAARAGAAKRFLREARAAARVEHDNVVPIWQVGEDQGVPFIAMPYLRGESLADRLRREPVAPPELTLKVGREVAEGLAAAHDRGLIHRDVKPGNIWLEGDPGAADPAVRVRRCKILDFGLARPRTGATESEAEVAGSPGFMSPEQARSGHVDPRTDLFGLGAVLYRMATGRMPFEGPTLGAVLAALATEDPPRPDCCDCPAGLPDLILQLLNKDPAARPATARAVADAFRQFERPEPPTEVASARRAPVPRRWVALAGLALVAATVAGGVIIKVRKPDGKETTLTVPEGSTVYVDPKGATVVELPKGVTTTTTKAPVDANRNAAEWVLGCGGRVIVRVGEAETTIAAPQRLPDGPLTVVGINLFKCDRVTDAGLANLTRLTELSGLTLASTPVTDAGMVHLQGLTALTALNLAECPRVTDVGLIALKGMTRLEYLNLHGVSLPDAGLRHLDGLSQLTTLNLSATPLTDDGLIHLKRLAVLKELHLANTLVTGRGFPFLAGLENLRRLMLTRTAVTDDGLKHLARLPQLTTLSLAECAAVTDKGLGHVRALIRLEYLNLHGTGVTDAGLKDLSALTGLTILNLSATAVTDDGLAHLPRLADLAELHLYKTAVAGPGLKHLTGCPKLARLYLTATRVTDADLKEVAALKALTLLDLNGNDVSDNGIAKLKELTGLTYLVLMGTKVTDAGLAHLKDLGHLAVLDLRNTSVTASGIESVRYLAELRELKLDQTGVTAADADRLRGLMPRCRITYAVVER
jgi:eukaryotic-like serine/threonine-protein kinase